MSRAEAARRAHVEFGHIETHRAAARAARGLRVFDLARFSWIDVRLGLRMLVKHPWLTTAAVLALAIGIPTGLAPVHLARAIEAPLPEDADDRVRAIRLWDPVTTSTRVPEWEDWKLWSEELTTFSAMAAFRTSAYNVASTDGRAAPVAGAQVTASLFGILGRPPLAGRTMDASDDVPGAAQVVVLGHDLWVSRFGADPDVVGRVVRVGGVQHTVVGVMPDGFLFPIRHQLWLPLRNDPSPGPGRVEGVRVLGRLANGVSPQQAQAELGGLRLSLLPHLTARRDRLLPEVVPFGMSFIGLPREGLDSMPTFVLFRLIAWALLLVASGNVAMLVFARTATRFREMAVRTALGASRARIVFQVFVEALVLSVLAAFMGVLSISWVLGRLDLAALVGERALPYWLSLDVTTETLVRALGLAVVSATVAGVLPALRITGKGISDNIRRGEAGRSGIRFGGVTGALIVADVAVSVAALGVAVGLADRMADVGASAALTGIPADEYLAVQIGMPEDPSGADGKAHRVRRAAAQRALVDRLRAEPGVKAVAVADVLPRMNHRSRAIEIAGVAPPEGSTGPWVRVARVDVDFFEALGKPMLAGRDFGPGDVEGDGATVVVNTVFVDRLLGGRDALGRRLRFTRPGRDEAAWLEIVGVVGHLGANIVNPQGGQAVYVPVAPGALNPLQLGLHVSSPEQITPRLRSIAAEVAPEVMVGPPVVLGDLYQGDWYLAMGVAGGLTLLVGVLVMLAVSGIYAMMSFSVTERTREIGVRAALGARSTELVTAVVRRSLTQVGLGALVGAPVVVLAFLSFRAQAGRGAEVFTALLVGLSIALIVVLVVGMVSCLVPTRRILRIPPSLALRAEG